MKTYIPIIIGLLIIIAGWNMYSKKNAVPVKQEEVKTEVATMKSYENQLTLGKDTLSYTIDIPENASTTVEMNNALVRITDKATPYATVYASYQGGRNRTPEQYLSDVIAPHVSVINPIGEAMIGNTMWYKAESATSEWHIASVADGKWLVIVESKKTASQMVEKSLSSFAVK